MDLHPFFLGCRVLSWGIRPLLVMLAFLHLSLPWQPELPTRSKTLPSSARVQGAVLAHSAGPTV